MTLIPDAKLLIHQSVAIARAVIFGFKLIYILRKLLFFALQKNIIAEELLLKIKQKFPVFEFNWRGYSYIRLFPFPFMEVVFVYFPPGSYTGIDCHDGAFNINKVILSEISDTSYRICNCNIGTAITFDKPTNSAPPVQSDFPKESR